MNRITANKAKKYLIDMYDKCEHCPDALAFAANEACYEFSHDNAFDLFKLLVSNEPIPALMTHNYGFHTATGRHIIETIKEYYYEYEN
tara:strand:+ start:248 stop:511 length:264 start_codon:yes stop_codon:yes gene_type:complete